MTCSLDSGAIEIITRRLVSPLTRTVNIDKTFTVQIEPPTDLTVHYYAGQ